MRLLVGESNIFVHRLSGLPRQFESDRLSGLFLSDRRSFNCISVWSNVLDRERDHITTAQLTVDSHIEHRQAAEPALRLSRMGIMAVPKPVGLN